MEQITNIGNDNINNHWVSLNNFDINADIKEEVQIISCDTRDFHITWGFERPKITKKAECGYEISRNEGLFKLYSILKKSNKSIKKQNVSIDKKDILKWLKELYKNTGGERSWRYISLSIDIEGCQGWNLKYIRFIKDNNEKDKFIVCNSYLYPIEYKKIISNLDKEYLY